MRRILALCCAAALPLTADAALRGGAVATAGMHQVEPVVAESMAAAVEATNHLVSPPEPPSPVIASQEGSDVRDGAPRFAAAAGKANPPKWLEKPPYWLPTPPEWGPPPAHIFSSFYAPNTIPQPVFRPSPFSYDSTNFRAPAPWTSPAITTSALPGGVVGIPATSRYAGYMNIPSPGALSAGSSLMTAQQQWVQGQRAAAAGGVDPGYAGLMNPYAAAMRGPAPGAMIPPAPIGGFPLPAGYMYTQASGALAPPPAPNVFVEMGAQGKGGHEDASHGQGVLSADSEAQAEQGQQQGSYINVQALSSSELESLFPMHALPRGAGAMDLAGLKKAMALHAALASDSAERRREAEAAVLQHARSELAHREAGSADDKQ